MLWDVFCRVVDNFGDIGVCWRLAADLAARGERVRLWVDDASALRWMAPDAAASVEVLDWTQAEGTASPGDVVIEAFGFELPTAFVEAMAARRAPPVWINLEYLSAEPYARRSHGLSSPQAGGPGAGLHKWFFYPGFQNGSGGLLREADLSTRQQNFSAAAWLAELTCAPANGERVVSLFCYDNPCVPELLLALSTEPTLLLVTPGAAQQQVQQVQKSLGAERQHGLLRIRFLPWLSQTDYDHLLWACDLNFVRGEDSFVRAQWAGKPFVWQIYPQHDGAHALKLQAFTDLFGAVTSQSTPQPDLLWPSWSAWNGLTDRTQRTHQIRPTQSALKLPKFAAQTSVWATASHEWRKHLLTQTDLTSQLQSFVAERR